MQRCNLYCFASVWYALAFTLVNKQALFIQMFLFFYLYMNSCAAEIKINPKNVLEKGLVPAHFVHLQLNLHGVTALSQGAGRSWKCRRGAFVCKQ